MGLRWAFPSLLTGTLLLEREAAEDAEAESSSGSDAEEGGPRGAASGPLPSRLRRQVHFRYREVAWPLLRQRLLLWHCSRNTAKFRRKRVSELIAVLMKRGWRSPVPSPNEFLTGIRHANGSDAQKGKFFSVARALASTKVHFLGELRKHLDGVGFDSDRLFCEAFPSLQPASGACRRAVECADRDRKIWETTLRKMWGVETLPDFLKHVCNKHDGEARLIVEGDWARMPADVDVRDPALWSPQFVARTNQ